MYHSTLGLLMRRRSSYRKPPRSVTQSFKKVLSVAEASRAVTNHDRTLVEGVDSVAAGQTSAVDAQVPTGSVIKYIEIHHPTTNLVSVANNFFACIQLVLGGQTALNPNSIGGATQRNQVFAQRCWNLGKDQNSTHIWRFKIPKKYQRVREGMKWVYSYTPTAVFTDAMLVIYKFYR